MSLAAMVHHIQNSPLQSEPQQDAHAQLGTHIQNGNAQDNPDQLKDHARDEDGLLKPERARRPLSQAISFKTPPDTPAARTGPPRSLSFSYSLPHSPALSGDYTSTFEGLDEIPESTNFRGALEYFDRPKGKKRESRLLDEGWNPMRWFQESPREEKPQMDFSVAERKEDREADHGEANQADGTSAHKPQASGKGKGLVASPTQSLKRSISAPHQPTSAGAVGRAKWAKLRSLMPKITHPNESILPGPSAVTSQAVNITDELITGGLATLMPRLWMERDEKGHRRIPILFHRLRIHISDSLHPMHGQKSVFRIECEYANGAARWVVYRELRDFLSLHGHYSLSNVYNRNIDKLPEFPKTSLPYFKFLRDKGDDVGHADFARMQREVLENYLISLIRAVMFHPSANRLAGFLEISALSISLAQSGGTQYKGGVLRVETSGNSGGGFGRKSASWATKKKPRWCAIRESYLVVMEEAGELDVWDVFLVDSDFRIERPKRYYRHPFDTLIHGGEHHDDQYLTSDSTQQSDGEMERKTVLGSIRSHVSKIFHHDHHTPKNDSAVSENGHANIHSDSDGQSTSASDSSDHMPLPMLDPSTNVNPLADQGGGALDSNKQAKTAKDVSKHTFYILNSQTRLKLIARNERQMLQWITALEKMAAASHYVGKNRFDSFAPIRLNVAAQWLVDGRDYFWNLSRAILLAKDSIYIHDWWLSPELQMRRPNKDRYRLDNLLERKAKEGVKIYIILYQEVSNRTTPTDSNYAKQRLISLHPNIMVQRSPSHFQTGTFYWAHHEKMCVIDQTIAFMGGLDLCFGRWDTAQHVLTDDVEDGQGSEIWPGKDYSNPRISDFTNLNKPDEDMYDRTKVPRMPWHDVAMQIVGQPARDLARHFVQRWNYLLRIKNHSRVMPFLLPPPEFRPGELTRMGLTGTCELQICRSTGPWSMGTPAKVEHSIQNAYLKAIQMSEHFVYIENQFFITSTVVNDVKVENNIGDAIVHRIIRAHRDGQPWKCCIVIPLLPGFTFPVDHSDASAIRIILECQNRTIARGPNSIFSRLRKEGIDPDQHISIFSLRNWAKLRGDVLTTEQVYIHGKICIVDDRLAIIGSANINERSLRGDRDSELAAVIRDTDMIDGSMAGKPFQVGRFAHTLRVRLMREHLGVDVDALDEEDFMANEPDKSENQQEPWDPDGEQEYGKERGVTHLKKSHQHNAAGALLGDAVDSANQAFHAAGEAYSSSASKMAHKVGLGNTVVGNPGDEILEEERKDFDPDGKKETGFASSVVPTLEEKTISENRPPKDQVASGTEGAKYTDDEHEKQHITEKDDSADTNAISEMRTEDGELFGAPANAKSTHSDDTPVRAGRQDMEEEGKTVRDIRSTLRKNLNSNAGSSKTWTLPTSCPEVDPNGFEDPISDAFWKNVWVASAVHNTEIYRKVFHAIPDDLITTWKQYKEFVTQHEKLNKPAQDSVSTEPLARVPSEAGDEGAPGQSSGDADKASESAEDTQDRTSTSTPPNQGGESKQRKSSKREGYEKWEREEMEKLLGQLNGHLVVYPTRFLEGEDIANNFLFNADRLLPLPIYN